MTVSINARNDDFKKLLQRFGHHAIIKPTNFYYLEFKVGMNFVRLPNGKIAYYTINRMY